MAFMLCDHLWATFFPAAEILTCIGRMAFPIFAFMIAEGYSHTSDVKKYIRRMFIFALISEIPFDLLTEGTVFFPFHQNVLWTFLIALISMQLIDRAENIAKPWVRYPLIILTVSGGWLVGTVAMTDYFGAGVLTVLVFRFFRRRDIKCFLMQLVCLAVINIGMLGSLYYEISFGGLFTVDIVQQGLALFALIPIWLYNGTQGHHSKAFRYICYGFYPAHLLILYLLWHFCT